MSSNTGELKVSLSFTSRAIAAPGVKETVCNRVKREGGLCLYARLNSVDHGWSFAALEDGATRSFLRTPNAKINLIMPTGETRGTCTRYTPAGQSALQTSTNDPNTHTRGFNEFGQGRARVAGRCELPYTRYAASEGARVHARRSRRRARLQPQPQPPGARPTAGLRGFRPKPP